MWPSCKRNTKPWQSSPQKPIGASFAKTKDDLRSLLGSAQVDVSARAVELADAHEYQLAEDRVRFEQAVAQSVTALSRARPTQAAVRRERATATV